MFTVVKYWVQLWDPLLHEHGFNNCHASVVTMVIALYSSRSQVDWCKLCIHLRNLNVRHFVMVEPTGLKEWRGGHLHWLDLPAKFMKSTNWFKGY